MKVGEEAHFVEGWKRTDVLMKKINCFTMVLSLNFVE
jgi:hypothetical protein